MSAAEPGRAAAGAIVAIVLGTLVGVGCTNLGGLSSGPANDAGSGTDGATTSDASPPGASIDGPSCGPNLVCAPAIPGGDWQFVALGSATEACPDGYGRGGIVYEGITAPAATCTCACTAPTPTPSCPIPEIGTSEDSTCGAEGEELSGGATACQNQALSPDPFTHVMMYGVTPCAATPTIATKADVQFIATWQQCLPTNGSGTAPCPSGLECVAQVPSSFAICVASSTATTCPSGYPTAHTLGTTIYDTRDCGGTCTCGAWCDGTFEAYTASNCQGTAALTVPVDQQCHAASTATDHFASYSLTFSTTVPTCRQTSEKFAIKGKADFLTSLTVCCP